jgi:hypothetical protein
MVFALIAFAAPAQSQVVVQYMASLVTGFGDGPTIATGDLTFDTANNGQPACNAYIKTGPPLFGARGSATEARAGWVGEAVVLSGSAPQAVQFATQTKGAGGWRGLYTTCLTTHTLIPAFLTQRVQDSVLAWPASAGTFAPGGGFGGPAGSPFTHVPTFKPGVQIVSASTIPLAAPPRPSPKFGGALRVNGSSNVLLGIVVTQTPFTGVWQGTLPIQLSVGASGGTMVTYQPPPAPAPFIRTSDGSVLPGAAFQVFFPWTTGRVVASDRSGNFWTFRSRQGFDNRNAAGTSGTLQLVTPALTDIQGLAPLPFAITSVMTIQFMPEPGATLLLGAGVITLFGLYAVRRRQR